MNELWRAAVLACLASLIGCGGSSSTDISTKPTTPVTPPTPTGPVTTSAKAKFVYTGNQGANGNGSLSGYAVNPSTGALTGLNGFPLLFGSNPTAVTHDAQNRFLIVADTAQDLLTVFGIDNNTGALSQLGQTSTVREPSAVVVDPSGTHVYAVGMDSNAIGAFSLSASGALTAITGQPFETGGTQLFGESLLINASGTLLYSQDTSSIYVFRITAGTGALTLAQTLAIKNQGVGNELALDPSGNYFYLANAYARTINTYAVDASTGLLSPVQTSPTAFGSPFSIAVSPTGQFAYTIEDSGTGANLLAAYSLVAYSLQKGTFTTVGIIHNIVGMQLTVDPSGGFVYAPQTCSQPCTPLAGLAPVNVVHEFSVGANGALTELSGSPVAAGLTPWGITVTSQ